MDSGVEVDIESGGGESLLEGKATIGRPPSSNESSALERKASSGKSVSRSLPEPVSSTDIEEALCHVHSEGSDVVAVRHPGAGVDAITEADVAMMKIPLPGMSRVDSMDSQVGSDTPSGSGSGSTVKESIKKAMGLVPNTKSAPSLNFVDAAPEESTKNANGGLFQPMMRFMSTRSASMVTIPKLGEGSSHGPGHRPSSSQGQAAAQRREQEERSEQFRALSYLRKAREQRKGNDKAMDPTMMDATSSWVLQHSMSVGELNKIQVKKSVTTAQEMRLVSAMSGTMSAKERYLVRIQERQDNLSMFKKTLSSEGPDGSTSNVVKNEDDEDEEFIWEEVDKLLKSDRERVQDNVVSILEDLCKGTRFVAAELWTLPHGLEKAHNLVAEADFANDPESPRRRGGVHEGQENAPSIFARPVYEDNDVRGAPEGGMRREQSGLGPNNSALQSHRSGSLQSERSAQSGAEAGQPLIGGQSLQSQDDVVGGGRHASNDIQQQGSVQVSRGRTALAPAPSPGTADKRQTSKLVGVFGSLIRKESSSGSIAPDTSPAIVDSITHSDLQSLQSESSYSGPDEMSAANVTPTGGSQPDRHLALVGEGNADRGIWDKITSGAGRAARKAIKTGVDLGQMRDRLVFTGTRYINDRFYELGNRKGHSYYQKKRIMVKEQLRLLEERAKQMSYEFGEGVPGECWLRGDLDWNILRPLIDDPERPYDAHLETAATLFAASLAVPIFDIVRPHQLVAVVVCYTPHEMGQSRIHEYLDTRQNPELGLFMKEMSILMPLALRWMQSKASWARTFRSTVEDPKQSARRKWRVIRVVVKTGWLRVCKSDRTPKNVVSRLIFYLANEVWPMFKLYLDKFKGTGLPPPPRGDALWAFQSLVGALLGMACLSGTHFDLNPVDEYGVIQHSGKGIILIGSFAASCCLIFAAPTSPYAQPRMVFFGHLIAAVTAVVLNNFTMPREMPKWEMDLKNVTAVEGFVTTAENEFVELLGHQILPYWVSVAISPSIAIVLMTLIGVVHPPAAACCLIFITSGEHIQGLGWMYVAMPTLTGCCLMVLLGLIFNNMFENRKYPLFW